jgi:hypothetical protein
MVLRGVNRRKAAARKKIRGFFGLRGREVRCTRIIWHLNLEGFVALPTYLVARQQV